MGDSEAVLRVALITLAFFAIHSLPVTDRFKLLATRVIGSRIMRGWYRFSYTALSVLSLIAALWFIIRTPDRHIYSFPYWAGWPMHGLQLLGLAFGYLSYRQLNSGEFTGSAQVRRYLGGEEPSGDMEGLTGGGLIRKGGYRVVRNPLYLAGIMVFAFEPNITRSWLTVSVLSVMYFVWGAWIEQRRMLGRYGMEYRTYMREVPMLIPRPAAMLRWLRQLWG